MKFYSIFLRFLIANILFNLSFENSEFNPLKPKHGILNQLYNHTTEERNLFFIFLNIRHGARSPIFLKDKHNDILGGKWNTKGDLTSVGIKQHYLIGQKNKERYSSFINEEYDPKEIKIYSTPFPRTIMSVTSELLGFYSNNTYSNNYSYSDIDLNENDIYDINNKIIPPIQLFSYNKIKNKFDRTFQNHFECAYMREQVKKNWEIPHDEINSLIYNFYNEFSDALGKEFKSINLDLLKTPKYFDAICDDILSLYFDKNNFYILKNLEKHGVNIDKMKEMCDDFLYKQFIYIRNGGISDNNPFISISPIIINIFNWMKVRADKNNNFACDYKEPKFVIYSGHDSTLFQMQTFLKECFNIEVEKTEFASTQLMELRKYGKKYYVEIYYNDRLKMNITLPEFEKQIKKNIFSESKINSLCNYEKINLWPIFLYLIIFALIISLIIQIYMIYNENKSGTENLKVVQIA